MERGANIASESVKGPRSYIRLNSLKEKIGSFSKRFKEIYGIDLITDITEEQAIGFFYDMQTGKIKRKDGKDYENVATHVRIFKAFWHWHQKVSRKNGIEIQDITKDLDTSNEKPDWTKKASFEDKDNIYGVGFFKDKDGKYDPSYRHLNAEARGREK